MKWSRSRRNRKRNCSSIRQEGHRSVAGLLGREIRLRLRGRPGEWVGRLDRIESRATTAVPHPALAASSGGPLALRTRIDPLAERGKRTRPPKRLPPGSATDFTGLEAPESLQELARPRFLARASLLRPDDAAGWLAGEWGYVRFGGAERQRLGIWAWQGLLRYLRDKLDQARESASATPG